MAQSSFGEVNLLLTGVKSTPPSNRSQNPPLMVASCGLNDRKEKRQPSITPRKFQRFFTPRSHSAIRSSPFRRALEDVTLPVNNRNGIQSSPLSPSDSTTLRDSSPTVFTRDMKRRKLLHTPSSSLDNLSPEKSPLADPSGKFEFDNLEDMSQIQSSPCSKGTGGFVEGSNTWTTEDESVKIVKHLDSQGLAGQLLQLNIGYGSRYNRRGHSGPTSGQRFSTC